MIALFRHQSTRRRWTGLAAVLALVAIGLAAASLAADYHDAHVVCEASGAPLHYPTQRLGIAGGSNLPNPTVVARLNSVLSQDFAHVQCPILRFDIEWRFVEPHSASPSELDWGPYQPLLSAIRSYNQHRPAGRKIQLQAIVDNAPQWANPTSGLDCQADNLCAPDAAHTRDYGTFAGLVEAHLNTLGFAHSSIELWNEPNTHDHFQPQPDPALFTAMLKSGFAAVKATDPQALVVSGGLAPSATAGINYAPADFVTALYQTGVKGSFDALGTHPYDSWTATRDIHSIMQKNGDGGLPIMATEVGVDGTKPNAAAHMQALLTEWRQLPWVETVLWYSPPTDDQHFGLYDASGHAKPSLAALFRHAAQLIAP